MSIFQVILNTGMSGLLLHVIGSILVRWSVSLGPYSGKGKAPIFGDYEAQRHWQEITFNLPAKEWYTNSTSNDLLYWGLDYPPLTAYHSLLCGYVAHAIDPSWVQIHSSRGTESYHHKLFMRYTVLIADLAIFYSAVMFLCFVNCKRKSSLVSQSTLLLLLFYPGLILIDHGHFQYNCISLGLFIWSVIAFEGGKDIVGSIAFCLALNYKQMELYHALPIFFFLLGKALQQSWTKCLFKVLSLGLTVLGCFVFLWAPYIGSVETMLQVINRLFPLNRGLYEDKVANVWCSLSMVIKLKEILIQSALVKVCAGTTFILSLPSCIHVLTKPNIANLKLALVNVSLIFFLFSYQVHEKSILIPAVSACLLCGEVHPFLVSWFLLSTVFSMSPLLRQDGLGLQQVSTLGLFFLLTLLRHRYSSKTISSASEMFGVIDAKAKKVIDRCVYLMFWSSMAAATFLLLALYLIKPPARYPDLIPVLISDVSCAVFLWFAALFHYAQFFGKQSSHAKKIK